MSHSMRLQLPATSANLGPGFDAVALALELYLEIDAMPAPEFSIAATGRDCELCRRLEGNLLLQTYRAVLAGEGRRLNPLAIAMRNEIPLGMGCGSSAAARLAGVALAAHFGELGWESEQLLRCAARLEGHPDNVAACWRGGLTIAAGETDGVPGDQELHTATFAPPAEWRALLVLPDQPLATTRARAVLPTNYSGADAVANVQSVALLVAAFAQGRGELLAMGTRDCLHQPYRAELCPLLGALSPLAGSDGVLSVTLSGAGPSVLLLIDRQANVESARAAVLEATHDCGPVEVLDVGLAKPTPER